MEFLSMNVLESFNTLMMVLEETQKMCDCSKLTCGTNIVYIEYFAKDKKPTNACETIEDWSDQIELIFSNRILDKDDNVVLKDSNVKHLTTICKLIFRVYAHMATTHKDLMGARGLDPYFNSCFKSFIYFTCVNRMLGVKEYKSIPGIINGIMKNSKYNPILKETK